MRESLISARWLILLVGATVSACAGNGEGLDASGRPIGDGGSPGDTSDFTQIQETIFTPICTACHAGANAPLGLRLDADNSYALLVSVPSSEVPSLMRVTPGDPENSYIVQKIEGRASVGSRMPLGGPPLPQASIDLIKQWIAAGAPQPTASAVTSSEPLRVMSTIPAADEQALAPMPEVLVVFNKDVDVSLATPAAVTLTASGGDGTFGDGNEREVAIESVRISPANPTLMSIKPAQPLTLDQYRLALNGSGVSALAGIDARTLDGNVDGRPGGDFTLTFAVAAGEAQ